MTPQERNLFMPTMPPRIKLRGSYSSKSTIWSVEYSKGSSRHSGYWTWEEAFAHAFEESTKRREAWFKKMQQRGKAPTGG